MRNRRTGTGRSVPKCAPGFVSGEGHRSADGGLLGERGEREAECGGKDTAGASAGQVEGKSPQGESGSEEVRVCQRALREPHRIERGEQRGGSGDGDLAGYALGQPVDRQQCRGGDDQLGKASGERGEAGELPPQGEIDGRQRRVRVRKRAVGNERAGAEEVVGGRDVVAGLVPVVGQVEQGEVREVKSDEDEGKDQPQGKGLVCLPIRRLPTGWLPTRRLSRGKSKEGDDCCLRGLWSG